MGAYNVLFHFDKLNKRLGPLRRRFSPGYDATVSTPTPLFMSSTIALLWMGVVLAFITFHEMSPGNKGNSELAGYYGMHVVFGCFIPLIYSFMINSDFWWSRRITVPLISLFSGFYVYVALIQAWSIETRLLVIIMLVLFWVGMSWYVLFSNSARSFYAGLRRTS